MLTATQRCQNGPVARARVAHDGAVLAFCTGGRSRVEMAGEWTLAAGDVFLVPAGQSHCMLEARDLESWTLGFSAITSVPLLASLERVREGAAPVVTIPSARHAHLASLFSEIERVGRSRPNAHHEDVERSLLTLILAEIAEASVDSAPPAPGVIGEALRFIERHCLEPLTLTEVAAAVGRNPAYLTTALKRATGRSAVQWIVQWPDGGSATTPPPFRRSD